MTPTQKAAMEQALEALEKYRHMMFVEAGCRFGGGDAAITALRNALAETAEPDIYPDEAFELGLERIAYYTAPQPPAPAVEIDKLIEALDWCVAEINRDTPASRNARAAIAAHEAKRGKA